MSTTYSDTIMTQPYPASPSYIQNYGRTEGWKNELAKIAIFAGVFLVLATVHTWLAVVWHTVPDCAVAANFGYKCNIDQTLTFVLVIIMIAELVFTLAFFVTADESIPPSAWRPRNQNGDIPTSSSYLFGVVAGTLGVWVTLLFNLIFVPTPANETGFVCISCCAFFFAWLALWLEMTYAPISGLVDRIVRGPGRTLSTEK